MLLLVMSKRRAYGRRVRTQTVEGAAALREVGWHVFIAEAVSNHLAPVEMVVVHAASQPAACLEDSVSLL